MVKNIDWISLGEKCPIEINMIISEAKSIEADIRFLRYIRREKDSFGLSQQELAGLEKVFRARTTLSKIISIFISLIRTDELLATPTDKKVFEGINERLGRLIRFIDIRIKDMKLEEAKPPLAPKLITLAGDLRDILYSGIYITLLTASKKEPTNVKRFLRAFLFDFEAYTLTFGALTREPSNIKSMEFNLPNPNTHNAFIQQEKQYNENPAQTFDESSPLSILDDLKQHMSSTNINVPIKEKKK